MKNFYFKLTLFVLIIYSCAVCGGERFEPSIRWTPPDVKTPLFALPKLSKAFVLDGNLKEWEGAACLPVRSSSQIAYRAPSHEWMGPADAGMEFYSAWNPDGLCMAAVVADDEVINTRSELMIYYQDCIEVQLDGRSDDKFGTRYSTQGCLRLLIKPPLKSSPPEIVFSYPRDEIEGLKVSGKRTDHGYNVELFIPWSALQELIKLKTKPTSSPSTPPFQPGREIGLQYSLVDYDSRDEEKIRPLLMSFGGRSSRGRRPDKYMKWVLVEELKTDEEASLNSLMFLDIPEILAQKKPVPVSIDIGKILSPNVGSVKIEIVDSKGREVMEEIAKVSLLPAPWDKSARVEFEWAPGEKMDDLYIVSAAINDQENNLLGAVTTQIIYVGRLLQEIEVHLKGADISALSQKNPFKAASYLGAGAVLEKIKRSIELSDLSKMTDSILEELARLDMLERGKLESEKSGLLDLLILTKNPEAQVVVEYSHSDNANVTFYWGAVPLVSVRLRKLDSEEDAASYFEKRKKGIFRDVSESITIGDIPARVSLSRYQYKQFQLDEFNMEKQIILVSNVREMIAVIDIDKISYAQAEAAVIMPDCPESNRSIVEEWAKKMNVPVLDFKEAIEKDSFLMAGGLEKAMTLEKSETFRVYSIELKKQTPMIETICSDRLITVSSVSRQAGEKAIELVTSEKPVKLSEVDYIRKELVKKLSTDRPDVSSIPEGHSLFLGDLHMHTFYSDGSPSPSGLSLQLMHCFMDYAAITDHNTIDGARLANYLLHKNGFSFPLIIGEEITTKLWHMNAYPLKKLISWELPADETVKAAHLQNAVIHLNHPGYPSREWAKDYLEKGFEGAEFDAWEHIPEKYDKWKKQGILPVIVGTTDTHSGLFSYPERTIIFAPTPEEDDVNEAIRQKQVVAVSASSGEYFFYGSDKMISIALDGLREGKKLKDAKKEGLRKALKNADLVGLLKSSQPKRVKVDDIIPE